MWVGKDSDRRMGRRVSIAPSYAADTPDSAGGSGLPLLSQLSRRAGGVKCPMNWIIRSWRGVSPSWWI